MSGVAITTTTTLSAQDFPEQLRFTINESVGKWQSEIQNDFQMVLTCLERQELTLNRVAAQSKRLETIMFPDQSGPHHSTPRDPPSPHHSPARDSKKALNSMFSSAHPEMHAGNGDQSRASSHVTLTDIDVMIPPHRRSIEKGLPAVTKTSSLRSLQPMGTLKNLRSPKLTKAASGILSPSKIRFSQQDKIDFDRAKSISDTNKPESWDPAPSLSNNGPFQLYAYLHQQAHRLVSSQNFGLTIAFLIVCHAIVMGVQVDHGQGFRRGFAIIEVIFAGLFVVELCLRLFAEGRGFLSEENRAWNVFDSSVVIVSAWEIYTTVGDHPDDGHGVGALRLLRVVRIAKVLRVFRLIRTFKALRIMVLSVFGTMKSLAWAVILMTAILYVFALVFVQCARDQARSQRNDENQEYLDRFYGDISTAMFTLFKAITGGEDWGRLVEPLTDVSHLYTALFIIYISFMTFAVMNVVTGHFCHKAIESANQDHDHVLFEQMSDQKRFVKQLKRIFTTMETNNRITLADFERCLTNDRMGAFFQSLEINITDAWSIFKQLDADGSHDVDIDEFVSGCMRLKGTAKSVDMAITIQRLAWLSDRFVDYVEYAEQEFGAIAQSIESLASFTPQLSLARRNQSLGSVASTWVGAESRTSRPSNALPKSSLQL